MIDGNRVRRAYTHCGCVLSEQWASRQKEEKFFHGGGHGDSSGTEGRSLMLAGRCGNSGDLTTRRILPARQL